MISLTDQPVVGEEIRATVMVPSFREDAEEDQAGLGAD